MKKTIIFLVAIISVATVVNTNIKLNDENYLDQNNIQTREGGFLID